MCRQNDDILKDFRGEVRHDEPMCRHTSLRVGGSADLFAVPEDREDLKMLLGNLKSHEVPYLVIGGGYNLLIRDGGFRGVVISLSRLNSITAGEGGMICAEAGVGNGALVRFAEERRLGGVEFLIGIPGTLGGGLAMNAGAHGEAIVDRVEKVTILQNDGEKVKSKDELQYGYRFLHLLPGEIIIAADIRLIPADPAEIGRRIEWFLAHRRQAQKVTFANAGSFFRNPPGEQAWRLISGAGLRGFRVGGAEVSEIHTNFLVNRGGATAGDFLALANIVKARVFETSRIHLEEEVRIVGEEMAGSVATRERDMGI